MGECGQAVKQHETVMSRVIRPVSIPLDHVLSCVALDSRSYIGQNVVLPDELDHERKRGVTFACG